MPGNQVLVLRRTFIFERPSAISTVLCCNASGRTIRVPRRIMFSGVAVS